MINYYIILKVARKCIFGQFVFIAETNSQITDNDVICLYIQRIVSQTDTIPRSSLSGDSNITIFNCKRRLKSDGSGNTEHNCACAILFDGISHAARPAIVQVGYFIDRATTATGCKTTKTFGAGKCQLLCIENCKTTK